MARPTILVVDPAEARRREIVRGLTGYGYEVVGASGAEDGRRFAEGLDPGAVVVEAGLVDVADPFGVRARAAAAGRPAPTVVLFAGREGDELPDGVAAVREADPGAATLLLKVRTALLAAELGLRPSPRLDSLAGDVQSHPLFELLPALQRAVASGRIDLGDGELFLEEGEVVAARCAGHGGLKALCRLARAPAGAFRLSLGGTAERELFKDLLSLMAIAIEDQHRFEEARAELPSLASRVQLLVGPMFFATQFSPSQQLVVEAAQGSRTIWNVLDRVDAPDGEVLHDLVSLRRLDVVAFEAPEFDVRVVTDSFADLPAEVVERLGVRSVPASLHLGGAVYEEGADVKPTELYRLLASKSARRHQPEVDPPDAGDLLAGYRSLVARSDVVSVHASEQLSAGVVNARAAVARGAAELRALRGDGEPEIEVVDGGQTSIGLGLLVVAAARMAARRLGPADIGTRIAAMRTRVHTLFVAETLAVLERRRGIGRVRAALGRALGIQPILGIAEGRLVPLDLTRTVRTAHARVIELLRQRVRPGAPVIASIAHGAAPLAAVRLRNLIQGAFEVREVFEGAIGLSMGTALGAGCVAVALLQPTAEEAEMLLPPAALA